MQYGIFNYGLKQQGQDEKLSGINILHYFYLTVEFICKTKLLNIQIDFYVFQLLTQRSKGGTRIFQNITHGFTQKLDCPGYFPVICLKSFHTDRFQSIIKKMRINLAGKHFKFHHLLFIQKLRFIDLGFIHIRILLFNILNHDFQIGEGLRYFILSLDKASYIIILIAGLMHGLS